MTKRAQPNQINFLYRFWQDWSRLSTLLTIWLSGFLFYPTNLGNHLDSCRQLLPAVDHLYKLWTASSISQKLAAASTHLPRWHNSSLCFTDKTWQWSDPCPIKERLEPDRNVLPRGSVHLGQRITFMTLHVPGATSSSPNNCNYKHWIICIILQSFHWEGHYFGSQILWNWSFLFSWSK